MASNPPESYHTITPSIVVENPAPVIEFLTNVLGATERMRMDMPDGSLGHAEFQIGDSVLMLGQASETNPGATCALYVYVEDVDATHDRAVVAGATSFMAPEDQFYGDRVGAVRDPFGNTWTFATQVEEVSPEEMARRMAAFGEG